MPTTSFAGFSRPKFTQVPNAIIDDLMVELNESQLKVLLYITRKTFGWHKSLDAISLSQMESGTGMSPSSVKRACQELAAKGIINRINQSSPENGNEATVYGLRFEGDEEADNQPEPSGFTRPTSGPSLGPPADQALAHQRTKPYKLNKTEEINTEELPLTPSSNEDPEEPTEETIRAYTTTLFEELAGRGTSLPSGKWGPALWAAYQELGPERYRDRVAIFASGHSRNLDDFARGFRKPPSKSHSDSRPKSQGGSAPKFLREQRSAPVPQECQPPPEAIAWNKRVQPEHRWRAWDNSLDALWREATGNMNGHFGEWLDACEKLSPGALRQEGSFGSAFTLEKALQRWPKFVNGNYDWLAKGGVERGKGNSLLSQQSSAIKAALAEMVED